MVPLPEEYIGPLEDPLVQERALSRKKSAVAASGGDPSTLVRDITLKHTFLDPVTVSSCCCFAA